MRSSKMSLNSIKMKMQFSSAVCAKDLEIYLGENPITIGRTVLEIYPFKCCSKQCNTKEIDCYYWLYVKNQY